MDSNKVIACMEEIVKVGKSGGYSPEEFKSAIDSLKLLIEDKMKENEK